MTEAPRTPPASPATRPATIISPRIGENAADASPPMVPAMAPASRSLTESARRCSSSADPGLGHKARGHRPRATADHRCDQSHDEHGAEEIAENKRQRTGGDGRRQAGDKRRRSTTPPSPATGARSRRREGLRGPPRRPASAPGRMRRSRRPRPSSSRHLGSMRGRRALSHSGTANAPMRTASPAVSRSQLNWPEPTTPLIPPCRSACTIPKPMAQMAAQPPIRTRRATPLSATGPKRLRAARDPGQRDKRRRSYQDPNPVRDAFRVCRASCPPAQPYHPCHRSRYSCRPGPVPDPASHTALPRYQPESACKPGQARPSGRDLVSFCLKGLGPGPLVGRQQPRRAR